MTDVIDRLAEWPSRRELALDVGASPKAVEKWFQRRRVPAAFDAALVFAAERRGIALTHADLARFRAAAAPSDERAA